MSLKTKKRFKNLGKAIGIGLFTLLMLTNIKLALLDDNEIASGDISVLGIEMTLFEGTFANEGGSGSGYHHSVDLCQVDYWFWEQLGTEINCLSGGSYCVVWPCG